jgi:leader peptidase (prepilin peptidase)/N-methyltransferase
MPLSLFVYIAIAVIASTIVNYLSDSLPRYKTLNRPYCTVCMEPMRWIDYILHRPCSQCSALPDKRRWGVFAFLIIAFIWLFIFPPSRLPIYVAMILLVYLTTVAVIDLEHKVILHVTSLVGFFMAFIIGWSIHNLLPTIIGGLVGFLIMLLFYYLGIVFMKIINKRRGIQLDEVALGFGDVNLAGITGLMLGWPGVLIGLLFAILAGGFVSGITITIRALNRNYKPFTAIPYGPFLIFGAMLLLYRP